MKHKNYSAAAGFIILAAAVLFMASQNRHASECVSKTPDSRPPAATPGSITPEASTIHSQTGGIPLDNVSVINEQTLNHFKSLQHKFRKSLNIDDHLARVKEYLLSSYDLQYAEAIYETYKAWLECEMAVAVEFGELSSAGSPRDASEILNAIHGFRKNSLGEKLAEQLYGNELKRKLYSLNRASIVNNHELYGREKEILIAELNASSPDMDTYSTDSYNNYQETLKLYRRDLNEADSMEDRNEIVEQIRKATLPSETVKKLQAVDGNVRRNKEKEELYLNRKNLILSDKNLSSDEKENQINTIRSEVFGPKGAEAKVRMENLENGYRKIVSELDNQAL